MSHHDGFKRTGARKVFKKLHERVAPPGLETRLLKAMPFAAALSVGLPLMLALAARVYVNFSHLENSAKFLKSVDIFAWSVGATLVTAVFTVTIGCIVVWVMKGPAYVADSYPVSHAARPARSGHDKRQK